MGIWLQYNILDANLYQKTAASRVACIKNLFASQRVYRIAERSPQCLETNSEQCNGNRSDTSDKEDLNANLDAVLKILQPLIHDKVCNNTCQKKCDQNKLDKFR